MALFQSTGYPYYLTIPQGDYTVNVDGSPVYAGRAYPFPGQSTINLDVSSIVRNCINVPDFSDVFSQAKTNMTGLIHGVSVKTTEKIISLKYAWNYDKGNYSGIKDLTCFNDYITPVVYPYQFVAYNVYAPNDVDFDVVIDFGSTTTNLLSFDNTSSNSRSDIRTMGYMNTWTAVSDARIILTRDGSEIPGSELTFKSCMPENTMTLYYVNMKGAFSFVHCICKNVVKNNVTRNQYTQESRIDSPWSFGSTNYLNQISRTWTLNTELLNDKQSNQIQELFMSPRVWLYDYTTRYAIAVNVTDTSSEVKNRLNNHLFNYTINVKESQTYNILA